MFRQFLKKSVPLVFLLLFPLLLCLNVWQSLRFQRLETELAFLQEEQLDLVEQNKRVLAAVAVFSSPSRVGAVAEERPELEKAAPGDVLLLEKEGR